MTVRVFSIWCAVILTVMLKPLGLSTKNGGKSRSSIHKTLKSNTAMAKSPAHTIRTQSNHIFLSIYSAFRLEVLSLKVQLNHFQLRAKVYLAGLKASFEQLRELSAA